VLVLFDHGTPRGIARSLTGHTVKQARAQGWDTLSNGDLLDVAEAAGFDVLVTTDKNILYQQNLTSRKIALVVLGNPRWPVLRLHVERVVAPVNTRRRAV
jgi:hypothetical protein